MKYGVGESHMNVMRHVFVFCLECEQSALYKT